jgi:hypothetical protein
MIWFVVGMLAGLQIPSSKILPGDPGVNLRQQNRERYNIQSVSAVFPYWTSWNRE